MTGAGDAGPGVAVRSSYRDWSRAELFCEATNLRAARARLAAELAAARAEVEAAERERDEARAVLRAIADQDKVERRTCIDYDPAGSTYEVEMIAGRWAKMALAALDPPPRGATGPSGARDGRGEAADGGEGGGVKNDGP